MTRIFATLATLAVLVPASRADFQSGLDAYQRGDYPAALEAWLPIAERGDANAQYNVGLLCARGEGVPQDLTRAAEWYLKAAEQGVAAAQYNLAVLHANGQGVPQNMTEAVRWFHKAAQQGVPEAQDSLGYIYGSGQGVKKDFDEALKWYRLAAEHGIPGAQYNLGVMYDLGQGVPRDFKEALSWYRKAAVQGYGAALCNIGILWYNAQGVKRNLVESYAWMSRCESAGDPRGGQLRRIVESRLKPRDLERGRRLAAAWRPDGPIRAPADTGHLFAGRPANSGSADRTAPELAAPEAGAVPGVATAPAEPAAEPAEPPPPPPAGPKDITAAPGPGGPTDVAARPAEPQPAGPTAPAESEPPAEPHGSTTSAPGPGTAAPAEPQPPPQPAGPKDATAPAESQPPAEPHGTAPAPGPGAAAPTEPQDPAAPGSTAPAESQPSAEPHGTASAPGPGAAPDRTASAESQPSAGPHGATAAPGPGAPTDGAAQPAPIQDTWNGVERVVAVGDVLGDFEQLFTLLESAGLIDGNGDWTGGRAHLVQTGNAIGRGPDSRKIMDLLMRLEKQAAAAGGAVHCLVGSHEAMTVYGDLRYVAPGEFAAFGDANTQSGAAYGSLRQDSARPEPDRANWVPARPPGFEEHRQAFAPTGPYGAWIASHNAAVMIDGILFVHAGIGPSYAAWGMRRINETVRGELAHPDSPSVLSDPQGPLWYEGLATGDEAANQALLDGILQDYGARRIVLGHADAGAAVTSRFGGRILLVNTGISRLHASGGRLSCLVIENGMPYALHRGQKLELPTDEGADLLRYLKQAAALDPQPSPLEPRIAVLESSTAARTP